MQGENPQQGPKQPTTQSIQHLAGHPLIAHHMVHGGVGVVVNRTHTAPAKAHKTGFFEGDQPGVEWEEVELEGMTHMSQVQYYTGAQKTAEGGQEGGVHRRGPVRTGRGSDHSTGPASAQQPDQGTHWQIGTMAQKPQGDRWHNKGKGGEGEGAEEGAKGQGGQRQGHQRGDRRHTVLPHRSAYYAGNGEGELTPARTYSGEPGDETVGDALTEAAKLVRPEGKYLCMMVMEEEGQGEVPIEAAIEAVIVMLEKKMGPGWTPNGQDIWEVSTQTSQVMVILYGPFEADVLDAVVDGCGGNLQSITLQNARNIHSRQVYSTEHYTVSAVAVSLAYSRSTERGNALYGHTLDTGHTHDTCNPDSDPCHDPPEPPPPPWPPPPRPAPGARTACPLGAQPDRLWLYVTEAVTICNGAVTICKGGDPGMYSLGLYGMGLYSLDLYGLDRTEDCSLDRTEGGSPDSTECCSLASRKGCNLYRTEGGSRGCEVCSLDQAGSCNLNRTKSYSLGRTECRSLACREGCNLYRTEGGSRGCTEGCSPGRAEVCSLGRTGSCNLNRANSYSLGRREGCRLDRRED